MPIYEYLCSECDSKFEQLRPLSQADKAAECPRCHKPARRKISTFNGFVTSGSGVPRGIAGNSGPSCSSCSSGNCGTCAS
jgi:putative FmdB family regulatory protein